MALKQVILARKDLSLSKGKLAAQVAHASVEAVLKSDKKLVEKWHNEGMKKVVLKVENEKELIKYQKEAKAQGLTIGLITDAGLTEIPPGTKTCLGVGPDEEEKIDTLTYELKMM